MGYLTPYVTALGLKLEDDIRCYEKNRWDVPVILFLENDHFVDLVSEPVLQN